MILMVDLLDNPFFRAPKGKRKPSKSEAKKRIDDLPPVPNIPLLPPLLKPVPKLVGRGAKELAKALVDLDPLGRTSDSPRTEPLPITRRSPESFITPSSTAASMDAGEALRTVINDPAIRMTPEMMDLVNDTRLVVLPNGEIAQRLDSQSANLGPRLEKPKRKSSKYSRIYRREFRRLAPRYKKANGKWKKDGFKSAVRAAHRETRKILGR